MKPEWQANNERQALAHVLEEAGEFIHAAGKTMRWGEHSYDPTIPVIARELNIDWMKREFEDLKIAYERYLAFYTGELQDRTK